MNPMLVYITTCYPEYTLLARAVETLPLSARSLLIKTCQAQINFTPEDTSSLALLVHAHPPVAIQVHNRMEVVNLCDVFSTFEISVSDPLRSAICLDILRSASLDAVEIVSAREKGWATEIRLAETPGSPCVNFNSFFFPNLDTPLHPDLPFNHVHLHRIQYRFERFKDEMLSRRPVFYPRATHKNMSRSTRREFEKVFEGSSLQNHDIFGQDDWERVYHEHGVQLEGLVEMRQKWYPSNAKPRTYFAMGGTCYRDSRFLQDFFTELVNLFPATNHITRLRPSRLRISVLSSTDHYLIYDLTSFTSNMVQQQSFMLSLTNFFRGVPVVIVDEMFGPLEVDLGDLLEQYCQTCVNNPALSYERSCFPDLATFEEHKHARASLLGIFGNLMTCTLAHYLIISPVVTEEDEINIAGDDGLVLKTLINQYLLAFAIDLVGLCAPDKTMESHELGAVCLKRPLREDPPSLELGRNVVPPSLATSVAYFRGDSFDPRYEIFGLDTMTLEDRIGIVGKDLMRFLESCFKNGISQEEASKVFRGFQRLAEKILGVFPRAGNLGRLGYMWPVDPMLYDYYSVSPLVVYGYAFCESLEFRMREEVEPDAVLMYAGDVCTRNSSRRIVLLERLGYLEKEPVTIHLSGIACVMMWLSLQNARNVAPVVYKYTCLKDLPTGFIYEDDDL